MTLPKDYNEITSENGRIDNSDIITKTNKKYIQIKIPVIALIVIGISIATFFAGYYTATFQKVGFIDGYNTGYIKGVQDLFGYNVTPNNWIIVDQKSGIAAMNGTNVVFAWIDTNQNTTKTISLKSETSSQYRILKGVLVLLSDPVKVPQNLANSTGLHSQVHYIFEDQNRNKYLLEPNH